MFAINCGGGATGDWAADAYYSPNSRSYGNAPGSKPVLNRLRWSASGPLVYTLPLPSTGGRYRVRLTWSELYFRTAGRRRMRVSVTVDDGVSVVAMNNLDVVAAAGGSGLPFTLDYPPASAPPLAADTSVRVVLDSLQDRPFLTSLRLETDVIEARTWSKGINCGSSVVVSALDSGDGRRYEADSGYSSGSATWGRRVALPYQLQTLRYTAAARPLAYTIPVPFPGRYRVTVTFTELYFQEAGHRQMDVYVGSDADEAVQGPSDATTGLVRVASAVDAFMAAGNAGSTPVSMTFPADGDTLSASQSLTVKLLSSKGDPMISSVWCEGIAAE